MNATQKNIKGLVTAPNAKEVVGDKACFANRVMSVFSESFFSIFNEVLTWKFKDDFLVIAAREKYEQNAQIVPVRIPYKTGSNITDDEIRSIIESSNCFELMF